MGRFGPVEILYNTNQLSCFVIVIIDCENILFFLGWLEENNHCVGAFSDWTQIAAQVCLATQSHLWIHFNC